MADLTPLSPKCYSASYASRLDLQLKDFNGIPQAFQANSRTEPHNKITVTALHYRSRSFIHSFIHSFSILSDDRSKASSKTMPPHSAMQSLLLQMRISSPVLKVIQ